MTPKKAYAGIAMTVAALADQDDATVALGRLVDLGLFKADLVEIAKALRLDVRDRDTKDAICRRIVEATVGQDNPTIREITGRQLHYAIEVTRDGGATWQPVDVPWRDDDATIKPAEHSVYRASAVESHGASDPAECATNIAAFYKLTELGETSEWPLWRVRVWIGDPTGRAADGEWSNLPVRSCVGRETTVRLTANHSVVVDPCDGRGAEISRHATAEEATAEYERAVERVIAEDDRPDPEAQPTVGPDGCGGWVHTDGLTYLHNPATSTYKRYDEMVPGDIIDWVGRPAVEVVRAGEPFVEQVGPLSGRDCRAHWCRRLDNDREGHVPFGPDGHAPVRHRAETAAIIGG
jgi:hypothetical protein